MSKQNDGSENLVQCSTDFAAPQNLEQKSNDIVFRDLRGNVVRASDIFPTQSKFNKTIFAPAGGVHSLTWNKKG